MSFFSPLAGSRVNATPVPDWAATSCSFGSSGKSLPIALLYSALNLPASALRSAAVSSRSCFTPFFAFISSMSFSKCFLPTSITTSENIWMKRR